jgi:FMN phosphatase YigB (HAD superfamily)
MYEKMISFDVDGVLANFTRGFTRIAHKLYGTPVAGEQSQQHWMFEDFPELGLDKVQCDFATGPIWGEIKTNPSFWADLDPMNVSIMENINRIKNRIFITNRMGIDPAGQTEAFLERWGIRDPYVVVASQKVPVAFQHHVIAHLDDYYHNVKELNSAGIRFVSMFYTPYNKLHHDDWKTTYQGHISLSVDHFIHQCEERGYVEY